MPSSLQDNMPLKQSARIIVILFLIGTTFKAVEPGLPSKTAVYVAAARAIGSKDPDPQLRNPDYLAIKFLGPRERAVLPDFQMDALDLDFDRAMKQLGVHLPSQCLLTGRNCLMQHCWMPFMTAPDK